jgi:hypothetical protein
MGVAQPCAAGADIDKHLGAKGHALYVPRLDIRFLKQLPCGGAKRRPPLLRILLGAAVGRDIEPVRGRSARYKLNSEAISNRPAFTLLVPKS